LAWLTPFLVIVTKAEQNGVDLDQMGEGAWELALCPIRTLVSAGEADARYCLVIPHCRAVTLLSQQPVDMQVLRSCPQAARHRGALA